MCEKSLYYYDLRFFFSFDDYRYPKKKFQNLGGFIDLWESSKFFDKMITKLRCQYLITFHTLSFQCILKFQRLLVVKDFFNFSVWTDNSVMTKVTEPKNKILEYGLQSIYMKPNLIAICFAVCSRKYMWGGGDNNHMNYRTIQWKWGNDLFTSCTDCANKQCLFMIIRRKHWYSADVFPRCNGIAS